MNYKCRNCGGELEYKPDIKKLACSSCFSTFNVEELQMNSLKGIEQCFCESCGAQLVFAEGESITQCPYCLSNQVHDVDFAGDFGPDGIIPFEYGVDKFIEIFKNTIKKRKLIKKAFVDKIDYEKVRGVYLPIKIVKVKANAEAFCRRSTESGNYYYNKNSIDETVELIYTNSQKADKVFLNSIMPYDLDKAKEFRIEYLSGFSCFNETTKGNEVEEGIKEITKRFLVTNECNSCEYFFDSYEILSIKTIYVPVWIFPVNYGNKQQDFYMNGTTMKIAGEYPIEEKYNIINYALPIIISAFVIALIAYAYLNSLRIDIEVAQNAFIGIMNGILGIVIIIILIINARYSKVNQRYKQVKVLQKNNKYLGYSSKTAYENDLNKYNK